MARFSLTICKSLFVPIAVAILLVLQGCTSTSYDRPLIISRTGSPPIEEPAAHAQMPGRTPAQVPAQVPAQLPPRTPATNEESKSSLELASLKLTSQGRALVQSGNPDDAISILEQSIGLDPKNGQSYYWLAEAWLLKQNLAQAEECNRLANLYLRNEPAWYSSIINQQERIRNRP